jgi:transglutaminase-like putative cysteine protease
VRKRNSVWLALPLLWAGALSASVPDWVRQATTVQVKASDYDDETNAVVLLDEQVVTIDGNGNIGTDGRRVIRILRPQGRTEASMPLFFDTDEKVKNLHAYTITKTGVEFEAKEKDAVEKSLDLDSDDLYVTARTKVIVAPEADAGSVVAFEWHKQERPYVLEHVWRFQRETPVLKARFTLNLPSSWEYSEKWLNHEPSKPISATAQSATWEVQSVAGIRPEQRMPHWNAVAGRMSVHFYGPGIQARASRTWDQFGAWFSGLAATRRTPSPQIVDTVQRLTGSSPDVETKVRAIANWMQHQIRYVSIQIGIGGYQPHAATDIFRNKYGDCKDKATLMSTMLKQAGIESEYVIVNLTDRAAVNPEIPSTNYFNHVILAIKLAHGEFKDAGAAITDHAGQRWLLFDPTDAQLRVGYIEGSMQGSYGVLVNGDHGELIKVPVTDPDKNYLHSSGKLTLEADGSLRGEITQTAWGDAADDLRAYASSRAQKDFNKIIEHGLNETFAGASVSDIQVENLEDFDKEVKLRFKFTAQSYGKNAGPLLLVRPRVFGRYEGSLDSKERHYAYEFEYPEQRKDEFEIALPSGYTVDELPQPIRADVGFAHYEASSEWKDNVLHYTRTMAIKDPDVPVEKIGDLRRLFGAIASDERNTAIFKKAQ